PEEAQHRYDHDNQAYDIDDRIHGVSSWVTPRKAGTGRKVSSMSENHLPGFDAATIPSMQMPAMTI
ncbi:hypothetical protein, partial [Pseudorhodoplanes sp.]|uniref:hypothetical protein n=1 Tax=Pseudorhodoplanes sp. TaxID=1934341 RepID=UPI002CC96EC2